MASPVGLHIHIFCFRDSTAASGFDAIVLTIPFCLCVFEIVTFVYKFDFLPLTLLCYLLLHLVLCLLLQNSIAPVTCSLAQVATLF